MHVSVVKLHCGSEQNLRQAMAERRRHKCHVYGRTGRICTDSGQKCLSQVVAGRQVPLSS